MASRRRAAALGLAALAGTAAGAVLVTRRWQRDDEPELWELEDGKELTVEATDGAVLALTALGDPTNPPVVLAHGWTNSRQVWMPVARRLAERDRYVVLYDQRGHGESTVGSEGLTLERVGADLRDVLQRLDLRDAVVVGHSMGGMTVQALAASEPDVLREHARALVLVATCAGGLGRPGGAAIVRFMRNQRDLGRLGAAFGPYAVRGIFGRNPRWTYLAATYRWFAECPPDVRAEFLSAMFGMDFSGALATLGLPTTVVIGSRDTLTPARLGQALADSIPDVNAITVPGAGHMLPLEEPDLLVDLITRDAA